MSFSAKIFPILEHNVQISKYLWQKRHLVLLNFIDFFNKNQIIFQIEMFFSIIGTLLYYLNIEFSWCLGYNIPVLNSYESISTLNIIRKNRRIFFVIQSKKQLNIFYEKSQLFKKVVQKLL